MAFIIPHSPADQSRASSLKHPKLSTGTFEQVSLLGALCNSGCLWNLSTDINDVKQIAGWLKGIKKKLNVIVKRESDP